MSSTRKKSRKKEDTEKVAAAAKGNAAEIATDDKGESAFEKLRKAIEKEPALRKDLVINKEATLKKFGISSKDFLEIQKALRTLHRFGDEADFRWPAITNVEAYVETLTPHTLTADTLTTVTIEGENFPSNSTFGLHDPKTFRNYEGQVEEQHGSTKITGTLRAPGGEYQLVVGTRDDFGLLDGVFVDSPDK